MMVVLVVIDRKGLETVITFYALHSLKRDSVTHLMDSLYMQLRGLTHLAHSFW
jgi:hypothetical protein